MPQLQIDSEHFLLQRVVRGDQRAFSELVKKYSSILYPYLLYWVKNTQQAEELVQDIFVLIWKKREQLESISNFSGYLYVIARNMATQCIKEKLKSPQGMLLQDTFEDVLHNPHATTELKELSAILHQGIEALPARRKEVFKLSRNEGLTYEAIAEKLQISRSTVREHMVEALVFLRVHVSKNWPMIVNVLVLIKNLVVL